MAALINTSGQELGVLTPLSPPSDHSGTDWLDDLEPPSQLFGPAPTAPRAAPAAAPTALTAQPQGATSFDFLPSGLDVEDFLSHPEPVAAGPADTAGAQPPAAPRVRTPYGQPLRLATDDDPVQAPAAATATAPAPAPAPAAAATTGAPATPFDAEQHRQKMIRAVLDQDSIDGMDLRTLIFDFGPFANIERELREISSQMLPPEIADALMSHVRQTLHDVVVVRPSLQKSDIAQEGIDARLSALGDVVTALAKPTHPATALMTKLAAQKADGVAAFGAALQNTLRAEQQRLGFMRNNLQPSTLGSTVFHGLRNMMKPTPAALVGNARRRRNAELLKAVQGLTDIAGEIRAHSGNADWERAMGPQSVMEAKRLRKRVLDLTKGVEDQIDHRDLGQQLGKVRSIVEEAGARSVDPGHRSRLDELTDALADLVGKLTQALGRMFGKEASSAAPPRP